MMRKRKSAFFLEMPILRGLAAAMLLLWSACGYTVDYTQSVAVNGNSKTAKTAVKKEKPRSVLRVSSEEQPAAINAALSLRLSDNLSTPVAEERAATSMSPEDQAEQARFAAILRGEDPALLSDLELRTARAEAALQKAERILIGKQSQADRAALDALRNESSHWIAVLGCMLIACTGIMGWLLWRVLSAPTHVNTSWDQVVARNRQESKSESESESTFETSVKESMPVSEAAELDKLVTPMGLNSILVMDDESAAAAAPQASPPPEVNAGSQRDHISRKRKEAARDRKAKEISNAVQRAEFWMSLNNPIRALDVLKSYRDVEKSESPVPWIWLLEIFQELGDEEKYALLGQQVQHAFNLDVPAYGSEPAISTQTLANFPVILERISELWESDAVVPYLENLLIDERDGSRSGFDLTVYRDIMRLITLAVDSGLSKRIDPKTLEHAHAILFGLERQTALAEEAVAPVADDSRQAWRKMAVPAGLDEDLYSPRAVTAADSRETALAPNLSQALSTEHDDLSDMTTKIHLAIVYQEIGEHDGARLLLDEVIKAGSPSQIQQARSLLSKLA